MRPQLLLDEPIDRPYDDRAGEPRRGAQLGDRIHLRLLIITAECSDPNLSAIVALLEQIGLPYDTLVATTTRLTQTQLWQGEEAFYQGVILTTGNLLYWNAPSACWQSAFDDATWQLLWHYERRFRIRRVILYAVGTAPEDYGLRLEELISTTDQALTVTFTEEGRRRFPYLNHTQGLRVTAAPVYLAQPIDGATLPLLVTPDGHIVATLYYESSGRELLALTMAHDPNALHTWLLGYGLVNWVTRGLFLGARRIYLTMQIDDIFNRNFLWDPRLQCVGGCTYRLTARDAHALISWLDQVQTETRNCDQLTLDFAFNGAGILGNPADDALAAVLLAYQHRFRWINHGYTHLLLDHTTYDESQREILDNHQAAVALGLSNYEATTMVTAVVSGLENREFLQAAADLGIRCLVSDTSKAGWSNPTPNTGILNPGQPLILCIPRRPTNLFYDVSTPEEWTSKYNVIYRTYWGKDLALSEIIEQEAELILRYLLRFEINPLMFHQANLRAYDGQHSLLSHLIDRVLAKYHDYYGDVPIISLAMHEIGAAMSERAAYNLAQVDAIWIVGCGLSLSSNQDLALSVTGVDLGAESTWYAGQPIAHFALKANSVLYVPLTTVPAVTLSSAAS